MTLLPVKAEAERGPAAGADLSLLSRRRHEDIIPWGMRSIVLTRELAGRGAGAWRPRSWQREIIDAIASAASRRISLCLYSRAGKSLIALVVLGHIITVRQISALFVLPSRDMLRDWNAQKVAPFLASCPDADDLVERTRTGTLSDRGLVYRGGAGRVHYRTSRVAGGLAQLTSELAWIDEVDDCIFPSGAIGYQDMMHQRGEDAIDPVWVESGTPSVSGGSAIERGYEDSDMREMWVLHERCGERTRYRIEQWAAVEGRGWMMHCESCAAPVEEEDRRANLEGGTWVPTHPGRSRMHRGYRLSMYYSPDHTISEVMATYDPEEIRGFYSLRLARTAPSIEVVAPDPEEYAAARCATPEGPLLMRTVGVDVQTAETRARLEATIVDYHGDPLGPTRWVARHFAVWVVEDHWLQAMRQLRQILAPYRPDVVMMDVGGNRADNSEQLKALIARAWPRAWPAKRVVCIKGIGGVPSHRWPTQPALHRERTRAETTDHRATLAIYTDILKVRIWGEGGVWRSGLLRFTSDLDMLPDDYWEQLTSEELRRGVRRTGSVEVEQLRWTRRSRSIPNEALDCLVYAEAGRLYLGMDYRRRTGRSVDNHLLDTLLGVADGERRGAAAPDR